MVSHFILIDVEVNVCIDESDEDINDKFRK
jgi:hypothetical protein